MGGYGSYLIESASCSNLFVYLCHVFVVVASTIKFKSKAKYQRRLSKKVH